MRLNVKGYDHSLRLLFYRYFLLVLQAEFESAMKAGSAPTKLAAATIPIKMDGLLVCVGVCPQDVIHVIEKVVPALASYQSSEYNFVACKVNVKKETVLHVESGNNRPHSN